MEYKIQNITQSVLELNSADINNDGHIDLAFETLYVWAKKVGLKNSMTVKLLIDKKLYNAGVHSYSITRDAPPVYCGISGMDKPFINPGWVHDFFEVNLSFNDQEMKPLFIHAYRKRWQS